MGHNSSRRRKPQRPVLTFSRSNPVHPSQRAQQAEKTDGQSRRTSLTNFFRPRTRRREFSDYGKKPLHLVSSVREHTEECLRSVFNSDELIFLILEFAEMTCTGIQSDEHDVFDALSRNTSIPEWFKDVPERKRHIKIGVFGSNPDAKARLLKAYTSLDDGTPIRRITIDEIPDDIFNCTRETGLEGFVSSDLIEIENSVSEGYSEQASQEATELKFKEDEDEDEEILFTIEENLASSQDDTQRIHPTDSIRFYISLLNDVGMEDFNTLRSRLVFESDVIALTYDLDDPESLIHVKNIGFDFSMYRDDDSDDGMNDTQPIVLVGIVSRGTDHRAKKIKRLGDLCESQSALHRDALILARRFKVPYRVVYPDCGLNVKQVFDECVREFMMPKRSEFYRKLGNKF